ncbi:NAD(P)-dependent oxidoreductase [Pedobacter yulinensis]|nr:NAD(P)-binding domain-containing protein [Pedobacter yulinensis]
MMMNRVTVIGLGPMGQSIAKSYLAKGYEVHLWNRTRSKADDLVQSGGIFHSHISAAINESELIIVSLTNYDIFYVVLHESTENLQGKVVVNLSSGTPEEVRKAKDWLELFGAGFLSGGIMVPPPLVGKKDPNSYTFYSGDKAVFDRYQSHLEVLSRTDYKGDEIGLAMLFYQASLNVLYASITGIVQSYAIIKSANIDAKAFEPYMQGFLNFLPYLVQDANIPEEIDTKTYDGSQQSLKMMLAGAKHVTETSREAHLDYSVPESIEKLFQETVNSGFGENGTTSIVETIRRTNA